MSWPRRSRPILLLALLATAGYFFYRWRQQQAQKAASPPAIAPAPALPSSTANSTPSAPRRIATRVHKGAPPSMPISNLRVTNAPSIPAEPSAGEEQNAPTTPSLPAEPAALGETPPAPVDDVPALLIGLPVDDVAEQPLGAAAAEPGLVNVNTADAAALIALPGIGPALAQRIIDRRTANGPFTTIDDLIGIRGIGPNNIDDFRHLLTV